MHLLVVDGFLSLLLSFLEPVPEPRCSFLPAWLTASYDDAAMPAVAAAMAAASSAARRASSAAAASAVRQSLLHGILGNAGQRFARLVAQLSIAFVSSRRQRGFFDLDEVLSDIRRCNP